MTPVVHRCVPSHYLVVYLSQAVVIGEYPQHNALEIDDLQGVVLGCGLCLWSLFLKLCLLMDHIASTVPPEGCKLRLFDVSFADEALHVDVNGIPRNTLGFECLL